MKIPLGKAAALLAATALAACGGGANSPTGLDVGGGGNALPLCTLPQFAGVEEAQPEVACAEHEDERLDAMSDDRIALTSPLGLAAGRYALPASSAPTQLVVFFHGNHNDSCSFRNHLRRIADRGAIAVAMDYSGQRQTPVRRYGWFVREGAADSIAAARYFLAQYPSITQVFAFGISMGGNTSGVAVASTCALRPDEQTPLFDWWVDVEGVNNLGEEYAIVRSIAPGNAAAALALQEIEEENGGAAEQYPERYAEISNVLRAPDMGALKGAVIVNGVDDGLVPTNQSPEMAAALNLVGVPAHLYMVPLAGEPEPQDTATGLVIGPVLGPSGQTYASPLAGHGWEGSDTHPVISTGFEKLYELMGGASVTPGATIVAGD